MDDEQLHEILAHAAHFHSAETFSQANEALQELLSSSALQLLPRLAVIASTTPHTSVLQMCLLILSRNITRSWLRLGGSDRALILEHLEVLLRRFTEDRSVRRTALFSTIATIARYTVPASQWDSLITLLSEIADSPARIVAIECWGTMLAVGARNYIPFFDDLGVLFSEALHSDIDVAVAAVVALGEMTFALDTVPDAIKAVLPDMLAVVERAVAEGHDEAAVKAISAIEDLSQIHGAFSKAFCANLIRVCLVSAQDPRLSMETTRSFIWCICVLLDTRRNAVASLNMFPALLDLLFQLPFDEDAPEDDEDDDEGQIDLSTPFSSSARSQIAFFADVLQVACLQLPSKQVYPALVAYISNLVEQRTGFAPLLVSLIRLADSPSRSELMDNIHQHLPVVHELMTVQDAATRHLATYTIAKFANALQPKIDGLIKPFLPTIVDNLVKEPSENGILRCLFALESCIECMFHLDSAQDTIAPVLPELLQAVVSFCNGQHHREVQGAAVSATASIVKCADDLCMPFYSDILQVVAGAFDLVEPEDMLIRSRAIECVGILFCAVGKEVCAADVARMVDICLEGIQLQDPTLNEYSFAMLANLSKLLEHDFAAFLPQVVDHILPSCNPEKLSMSGGGDQESDEDDEDDDSEDHENRLPQAIVSEVEEAVQALGHIGSHCGATFFPYVELCTEAFLALAMNQCEEIRTHVHTSLSMMVGVVHESYPPSTPYLHGLPARVPLTEYTHKIVETCLPVWLQAIVHDPSKRAVSAAGEAVARCLRVLGSGMLFDSDVVEQIYICLLALIKSETMCQNENIEDEDEEVEEDIDEEVMWACEQLLSAVSRTMGTHFADLLPHVLPPVYAVIESDRPWRERQWGIGLVADVIENLDQDSLSDVAGDLLALFVQAIEGDDVISLKRNAIYGLGTLVGKCSKELVLPHMASILALLARVIEWCQGEMQRLEDPDLEEFSAAHGAFDNAIFAVLKICVACVGDAPCGEILPQLLPHLPLRKDVGENVNCYRALAQLTQFEGVTDAIHAGCASGLLSEALVAELQGG